MPKLAKDLLFVMMTILFWSALNCIAQDRFEKLLTKKGQIISEGTNMTPVGDLKATTYRLEIVNPTDSLEVESPNSRPRIFRLSIKTEEKLPMETFSIWIDNVENYGAEQVGSNSVAMLIHTRTLRNGLSLGLSIRGKTDLVFRSVLPETLYVPPEYATPFSEIQDRSPVVILRRLPNGRIQMLIKNSALSLCHLNSYDYFVEIDGNVIRDSCGMITFTPAQFDQIRDGAEITLKRGNMRNPQTIRVIGRLDKRTLQ